MSDSPRSTTTARRDPAPDIEAIEDVIAPGWGDFAAGFGVAVVVGTAILLAT